MVKFLSVGNNVTAATQNRRWNGAMKRPIPITTTSFFLFCIVLIACTSGGGDDSSSTPQDKPDKTVSVTSNVPPSITLYQQPGSTLRAELRIDNGTPMSMTVSANKDKVQAFVNTLKTQDYTFTLLYQFYANGTGINIAQGEVIQNVTDGQNVHLVFSAFTYLDDDLDGFTNLAELAAGTDWNDILDRPLAEFPRNSANYVVADIMVPNPTKEGSVVLGGAASANYAVSPNL
jgi:hypothetical protein